MKISFLVLFVFCLIGLSVNCLAQTFFELPKDIKIKEQTDFSKIDFGELSTDNSFQVKKDGFVTKNNLKYFIQYADVPKDESFLPNAFTKPAVPQAIPNAFFGFTKNRSIKRPSS